MANWFTDLIDTMCYGVVAKIAGLDLNWNIELFDVGQKHPV